MKKPTGVSQKEWAKYKGDLELALKVMNKALDVIADANFLAGEQVERDRIIKLIKDKYAEVSKRNGYQFLPEQIEWLENLIKGEQK